MSELFIIYEDENILAVYKPAGTAVQTKDITGPDMISPVRKYLSKKGIRASDIEVVHRLDQPVRGVLIFAKNKDTLRKLNGIFSGDNKNGNVRKKYLAVVEGITETEEAVLLCNYIKKDPLQSKAFICENNKEGVKGGKNGVREAKLLYKTLEINRGSDRTLLEIELLTGRFHQIRAQLSNLGHPIAGDVKYGYVRRDNKKEGTGIALFAYSLDLQIGKNGGSLKLKIEHNSPKMLDFLKEWF